MYRGKYRDPETAGQLYAEEVKELIDQAHSKGRKVNTIGALEVCMVVHSITSIMQFGCTFNLVLYNFPHADCRFHLRVSHEQCRTGDFPQRLPASCIQVSGGRLICTFS